MGQSDAPVVRDATIIPVSLSVTGGCTERSTLQPYQRVKLEEIKVMKVMIDMLTGIVGMLPVLGLAYLHIEGYTERAVMWLFDRVTGINLSEDEVE
jgi:hypothetical protein